MKRILALALAAAPLLATADEGMWTFDAFPSTKVQAAYGFAPSKAWLDHARLASARIAGGCSASFVSSDGLVLTNHHCAHTCVEELSTAQRDYVKSGFWAPALSDEKRCPNMEIDQLVRIQDVTARVRGATSGLSGEAFEKALRGEEARIEKECQTTPELRCDVVTLYQGGLYHLYTYARFQDVRLVFAPEFSVAFFGGDPDNFEFPRYDLDVSFLRVYRGGKPAQMKDWFGWSAHGAQPGELTFVSGNPGGTDRALTVSELQYQRDWALPDRLVRLAELRGLLTGFEMLGPEQKRISTDTLFYTENSLKALRGRLEALEDPKFFASKVAAEQALRAELAKSPDQAKRYLPAFDDIARAEERLREIRKPLAALEYGIQGRLYTIARDLVRGAAERAKPNEERLTEYRESNLPALTQRLFSSAPVYPDLQRLLLSFSLTKMREQLGPDDPAVKRILGKESPDEIAHRVVDGTKLLDVAYRRQLWDGGEKAVAASDDPMIAFARAVDPDARAIRRTFENEVDAVVKRSHELVAEARFAVQGRTTYPDATFTLRLSYGQVKGWKEGTREVPPFTTFGGAFERATGRDPFALPDSWLAAKPKLDLATRLNFVTTNDIIGGNSGSPVFDRNADIVGLVFDGNIHSLGGDYGFDEATNRTVAVHSDGILEALDKIYGARRLLDELRSANGKKRAAPKR